MNSLLNWAAWAAAFFLAFVLFPHTVAMRLLLLFSGAGLVLVELGRRAAAKRASEISFVPPLLVPLALWAAWAVVSLTWTLDRAGTLKELKNEVAYTYLAFWLCYVTAQTRLAPRLFPVALGVGATAACAVVIYFFWFPSSELLRLGLHNGPGDQTSALLTLMPCASVGAWLAAKQGMPRSVRAASLALPLVFVLSAYATLNRTVWIGFAAQLAVLGALLLGRPEFKARRADPRWRRLTALAAVGIAVAGAGMTLYIQSDRFEHGWSRSLAGDLRLELWPYVVHRIEQRPWTGYGFGRGILRHDLYAEFHNGALWHPHNLILTAGVELGLPGIALLLVLLGATVRAGWRLAADRNDVAAACGAAVIAVVVGMFVRNMTDMLWARQNSLLYWGVIGALLAWGRAGSRPQN
ncbi:MAG TPA: O-antigen ligase family protein [Burkholderiales bacterium]|nr:O-antigen ligase family protein [Burkholderiales bacterium]